MEPQVETIWTTVVRQLKSDGMHVLANEVTSEVKRLTEVRKPRRVTLKLDYDLRYDQASKSMDCTRGESWTAFINKRRTLVHVMRHGHPSILIRLPKLNLSKLTDAAISRFLQDLLYEGL